MDSYKKIVAIVYLFLFFNTVRSQQLIFENIGPVNLSMRVHNHYDKCLILATSGYKFLTKIDSKLNIVWNFEIVNEKTNFFYGAASHDDGIYTVGNQFLIDNQGNVIDKYPFIASFNNCLDTLWHKKFIFNHIFDDTIIKINSNGYFATPQFKQIWVDNEENVYVLSYNEDDGVRQKGRDTIASITSYLYKLNKNGTLLFRKRIIEKLHHSSSLTFNGWVNGNMLFSGLAYYAREGTVKNDNKVYRRAAIVEIDTAGEIVNYKDFNNDDYYTSQIYDIVYHPINNEYFGVINGTRFDTITSTMHSELNLVKLNNKFEQIYRQTYNSQFNNEKYTASTITFDTNYNIIIHIFKELKDQEPNPNIRFQHGYFAKFDTKWDLIDSVKIDYLIYNNHDDSMYYLLNVISNVQNPNSKIYSGFRRQGLFAPTRSIIFKLNTSTLELDSINYPVEQNDWKCANELRGTITKTVYIHDTITINRRINATYNTWIGLNNYLQPIDINLSPNPATTQVHIESPIKIESYTLSNTSGTQVQSGVLEHDNNIDITQLPQGIYFLQLQLENGQRVVKKLVRSY